jgi:hypothetical protein
VKALAVVAVAVLLGACGGMRTIGPTASVQVPTRGGHTWVQIFDESGLLASAEPGQREGSFDFGGDVVADPENNTLTLHWLGFSCVQQQLPILTLIGDTSALQLRLEPTGGDDDINQANCPGDPSPIALVLRLRSTVTQDAVGLAVYK